MRGILHRGQTIFLTRLSSVIESDMELNNGFEEMMKYLLSNDDPYPYLMFENIKMKFGLDIMDYFMDLVYESRSSPANPDMEREIISLYNSADIQTLISKFDMIRMDWPSISLKYQPTFYKDHSSFREDRFYATERCNYWMIKFSKNAAFLLINFNKFMETVTQTPIGIPSSHNNEIYGINGYKFDKPYEYFTARSLAILETTNDISWRLIKKGSLDLIEKVIGRNPTRPETQNMLKARFDIEQLPQRERVEEEFVNLFVSLQNIVTNEQEYTLINHAKVILSKALEDTVINKNQKEFLMEMITWTSGISWNYAISRLRQGVTSYFSGYAHVEIVDRAFLQPYLQKLELSPQTRQELDSLKTKIENILDCISRIIKLSGPMPDKLKLVNKWELSLSHYKTNFLLEELRDFEMWYSGSPIMLHIYLPDEASRATIRWHMNTSTANAIRKIERPLEYFKSGQNGFEQLVKNFVLPVVDFCDAIQTQTANALTEKLIEKSELKEIPPELGSDIESQSPFSFEIIGYQKGTPENKIVQLVRRGFWHSGRVIRKNEVIVSKEY